MESLTSDHNLFAYLVGGAAAFVVGLFALYLLVRLVRGGRLWLFAPYVALMGTVSILFL
jgi:undecaprenyl pyrophosphate phosphatase UppP